MNLSSLGMADLVGMVVGIFLTLFIFSYIFGDNALFRLALHLFIGVSAGYAAVVVIYTVIWPQLIKPLWPLRSDPLELLVLFIPIVLAFLLLTKVSPSLSGWGSPVMAFLVGVGAAVAIGGALQGTLFPQVEASINVFSTGNGQTGSSAFVFFNAFIVIAGTLLTLIYFQFTGRSRKHPAYRPALVESLASVGKVFIAITLGVFFAGVLSASVVALVERTNFIVEFILSLIPGG